MIMNIQILINKYSIIHESSTFPSKKLQWKNHIASKTRFLCSVHCREMQVRPGLHWEQNHKRCRVFLVCFKQ